MADKRISQLAERTDIANNDVVAIVASGATVTNKATISSIQSYMQTALDVGVTSVGVTLGSSGTDVSVTGSPITTSGNITINIPSASATNRGVLTSEDWSTFNAKQPAGNYLTTDTTQTITGAKTFDQDIFVNGRRIGRGAGNITSNTTVGNAALRDNTTGSENSAFGGGALRQITTGSGNTSVGFHSMLNSETGAANTAIGNSTLAGNNGSNNIAIGNSAGRYIAGGTTINETSLNSVYLGVNTRPSADGNTNEIVIGHNAVGNGSNTVTIGKSSTTDNYFTGTVRSTALRLAEAGTANPTILRNTSGTNSITANTNVLGFNNVNNIFVTTESRGGFILGFNNTVSNREYTLQDASGTLAFTSDITNSLTGFVTLDTAQTITGEKTFTNNIILKNSALAGLIVSSFSPNALEIGATLAGITYYSSIVFPAGDQSWNLPNASGTIALTSDLGAYVTLGTAQTITAQKTITTSGGDDTLIVNHTSGSGIALDISKAGNGEGLRVVKTSGSGNAVTITGGNLEAPTIVKTGGTSSEFLMADGSVNTSVLASGAYLPLTGGTLTGALNGTSASFSGVITGQSNANTFGTASATGRAVIIQAGSTNQAIMFKNAAGGDATLFINGTSTSVDYNFNTYSVGDALVIKNNGNVGIGTTSPSVKLDVGGASNVDCQARFFKTSEGTLLLGGNRSTSNCPFIGSQNNFDFALITNDTERMRITSGGDQINYGNIFLNQTAVGIVNANATSIGINGIYNMSRVSGTGLLHIQFGNGGNIVGSVTSSAASTSYNTTSDYRLKEDFQEFNGLEKVQAIKVYDYKWKSEDSRMDGVLAHELAEILPYAVQGEKDAVDEDGKDKMQCVDYSKIVPILIKAIQELKTEIDSLKNQIK